MSLIDKLFSKQKIECPRCQGKGNVDWDDISRLKKELKWIPGSCAYCQGKGRVNSKLQSKVDFDTTYLTTDLPPQERKRLMVKDARTWQRALNYEMQTDNFIAEIEYLHFTGNLEAHIITEFYLLNQEESDFDTSDREELNDYIIMVLERKKEN